MQAGPKQAVPRIKFSVTTMTANNRVRFARALQEATASGSAPRAKATKPNSSVAELGLRLKVLSIL